MIEALGEDLEGRIRSTPAWREKNDLLRGVPGIGPVLSRTLLATLPELGAVSERRISSLVGLAPLADDSGQRHHPQKTPWATSFAGFDPTPA